MVLLLTCDCALLAIQVICHIARHAGQALEFRHGHAVQSIEDQQLRLHNDMRSASAAAAAAINDTTNEHHPTNHDVTSSQQDHGLPYFMYSEEAQMESRRLDQQMELMEAAHTRSLSMLDTIVFFLEVFANGLTVAHFLHIWSLHGMQFTLIDGVLALHLHSALAAAAKKVRFIVYLVYHSLWLNDISLVSPFVYLDFGTTKLESHCEGFGWLLSGCHGT
jgi:hypothetical protein